jgi:hypothetical protein
VLTQNGGLCNEAGRLSRDGFVLLIKNQARARGPLTPARAPPG